MNVPGKGQIFPHCSAMSGNSLETFKRLKKRKNADVPVVPPYSSIKRLESNKGRDTGNNNICIYNVCKRRGNRGTQQQDIDPRFDDPDFLYAVDNVLSDLGLDTSMDNFKKYDKGHGSQTPIDWFAYSDFIDGGKQKPKGYDPEQIFAQLEWIKQWNELVSEMRK